MPRVSLMSVEYFDPLESETLDLALERCVPRPRPPGLKIDNTWRFKTSIFKTYKRDDLVKNFLAKKILKLFLLES